MMSSVRKLAICSALAEHGIGRRHFVEFCAAVTATLALGAICRTITRSLEQTTRPVLVWLEFQDCVGNSESMLRSDHPPVADILLNLLS
jgi:hydrogenase small subunit